MAVQTEMQSKLHGQIWMGSGKKGIFRIQEQPKVMGILKPWIDSSYYRLG